MQAKLHEMITSESKLVQSNGNSEYPWMVDGAGLPPNASELLPRMVFFFVYMFLSDFVFVAKKLFFHNM